MQELKTKILDEIEQNKVKAKPKWLFAFKAFGLGLSVLFVFMVALYMLLFVGFMLSERDWVQDSTYSLSGVYFLFNTLPISLILIAGAMAVVAAFVAYKYGLSYKKPFIFTLLVIGAALLFSRIAFVKSGLQTYIKEEAFKQNIKLVPDSWRKIRDEVKMK